VIEISTGLAVPLITVIVAERLLVLELALAEHVTDPLAPVPDVRRSWTGIDSWARQPGGLIPPVPREGCWIVRAVLRR